ncbi:hypothetical protein CASFOL_013373 [Castilleja foliolosa]|uniref:MLO-like protein n=1 Tax=Castilleja foliolosa TaxID=1961234 RepID=A0ABD3DKD2_9LAMI
MTGGATAAGTLEHTPTWAVATVCFFIISISIIFEHSIHLLMNWLKRRHKAVLYDAIGRLKSEFMLLGFLSLLLAVTQTYISKICIPHEMANKMLPCGAWIITTNYGHWISKSIIKPSPRRLANANDDHGGAAAKNNANIITTGTCSSKGKVSLITVKGVEQLQHFIFVLAATQIVYSLLTVALGRVKMKRWEAWEKETKSIDYQNSKDSNKPRFPRQTTFGRRHETCTETTLQLWMKCFFRQFFSSVAKIDYLTLRHSFIMTHLSTGQLNNFNFQKYVKHSLDEDFKIVVSISPLMWFTVVIFMLVDIHGWHSYFWISFVPLLIVVIAGAKLEFIVATMALQLKKQKKVIIGTPLVEHDVNNFWFGQPTFLLNLMHFTLFLNAFEMAFFVWVSIEFGSDSCYHEHTMTIIRIVLAVTVQVICSYITLPLYALVTQILRVQLLNYQMGSQFRGEIFNENVAQVLKQWHTQVRRDRRGKQEETNVNLQSQTTITMANDNNSLDRITVEASYNSESLSEIIEEY